MGTIKATVKDIAETREFVLDLPDNVQISRLAFHIAEIMHFPARSNENFPINYCLLTGSGRLLSSRHTLAEAGIISDISLYLAPEVCAGVEEVELPLDYIKEDADSSPPAQEPNLQINIISQRSLIDDNSLQQTPEVRITASIYKEIQNLVSNDCHVEFAGLLLGEVRMEGDSRILEIKAVAPASGAMGSLTSVRFTPPAWEAVLKKRLKTHPDLSVLGWFHSHAGWGVFMSDADIFIHQNFFASPNHVCFIIDASIGRDAFFVWKDGDIIISPSYGIVGSPQEVCVPLKSCRKRKPLLDAKTFTIIVLSVMLMYSWFFRTPSLKQDVATDKPPSQAAASNTVVATTPQPKKDKIHLVSPGDTLSGIAKKYYSNSLLADELAKYNHIQNIKALKIGQELKIPEESILKQTQ